jgi:hypothetical protein
MVARIQVVTENSEKPDYLSQTFVFVVMHSQRESGFLLLWLSY